MIVPEAVKILHVGQFFGTNSIWGNERKKKEKKNRTEWHKRNREERVVMTIAMLAAIPVAIETPRDGGIAREPLRIGHFLECPAAEWRICVPETL